MDSKTVVVGILASHSQDYDAFKQVWIQNITWATKLNLGVELKFIFIYGGGNNLEAKEFGYWTELYTPVAETIRNMLRKTVYFYEHVLNHYDSSNLYILRTNLSTLFDFAKLPSWLSSVPSKLFLGGSIIDGIDGEDTTFSGTNTFISKDLLEFLVRYKDRFSYNWNEDVEVSRIIKYNIPTVVHKSVRRLDFLHQMILYHKCQPEDISEIFCYRFKSNNRAVDVELMRSALRNIMSDTNMGELVGHLVVQDNYKIAEELKALSQLANYCWHVQSN
jgi:hypothetical protein